LNGLTFALETLDGRPFDRAYAEARMRWEPLYEVTQRKGDGETHPFLSSKFRVARSTEHPAVACGRSGRQAAHPQDPEFELDAGGQGSRS
jgi:hypothetical protein